MKSQVILTCLLVISSSSWAGQKCRSTSDDCVHVISRQSDAFYFKVTKSIIGAEVDVFSATGEKVVSRVITSKHTLVDLYFQNAGQYSIVIRKGEFSQKFVYNKKTSAPIESISFRTSRKAWRYC